MPRLPRRSGAASRASRRRLNQSKRATQCHLPTPATQNDGRCEVVPRLPREINVAKCHACHAECRSVCVCWCVCVVVCCCGCVCVGVLLCVCCCVCVLSLCVLNFVCVRRLLCVKFVCVKFCMFKEAGGGGGEGARDTESKTRTPHKDVGNYITLHYITLHYIT